MEGGIYEAARGAGGTPAQPQTESQLRIIYRFNPLHAGGE